MQFELTASMMCANYGNLEKEVRDLEGGGIDSFHIDIMDGRYVPNFAMSLNDMAYIARGHQFYEMVLEVVSELGGRVTDQSGNFLLAGCQGQVGIIAATASFNQPSVGGILRDERTLECRGGRQMPCFCFPPDDDHSAPLQIAGVQP